MLDSFKELAEAGYGKLFSLEAALIAIDDWTARDPRMYLFRGFLPISLSASHSHLVFVHLQAERRPGTSETFKRFRKFLKFLMFDVVACLFLG